MTAVDVVVVAFASDDHIAACVGSVLADDNVSTVTVVDHGDGQSAARATRLSPRVTAVVNPANPGFGAGQNAGASGGSAPAILLLNPDAVLVRGALAEGLRVLGSDPTVAMVQGVILDAASGEPERSQGREVGVVDLYGRALGLRRALKVPVIRQIAGRLPVVRDHVHRQPAAAHAVRSLAATAPLVRRSAFEAVGGFDDSYFLYGEDLDLCRRLRQAGWTLVALPIPWATHRSGSSSSSFVDRELAWWTGTLRFAARWWRGSAFLLALPAASIMAARLAIRDPRRARVAARTVIGAVAERRRARQPGIRRSPASAAGPPEPIQRSPDRR